MSCGVGHRHSSDLALLWLWYRPVAVPLTRPLTWEPPYAVGGALKAKKKKKKKERERKCLAKIKLISKSFMERPTHAIKL